MKIVKILEYSDDLLGALNELLPQLSSSAQLLTEEDLKEIISAESSHLFMAKGKEGYCGSLTLVVFKTPTGTRAWIEDVVVSEGMRGKGIGKMLISQAIETAKTHGAKKIDLTSSPTREAANALYQKLGFDFRDTNVYRYCSK